MTNDLNTLKNELARLLHSIRIQEDEISRLNDLMDAAQARIDDLCELEETVHHAIVSHPDYKPMSLERNE